MNNEHPILMTPDNARLSIDGIKTQTRRTQGLNVVNRTGLDSADRTSTPDQYQLLSFENGIADFARYANTGDFNFNVGIMYHCKCPYGKIGDKLWVKEKHYRYHIYGEPLTNECRYFDNPPDKVIDISRTNPPIKNQELMILDLKRRKREGWILSPSLFMPRWASRLDLLITDIRVQRLQEIEYLDARAEGILTFDRENPDPANGGVGYNRGKTGLPMRYE